VRPETTFASPLWEADLATRALERPSAAIPGRKPVRKLWGNLWGPSVKNEGKRGQTEPSSNVLNFNLSAMTIVA
jgi:hypothetical protein